MSFDLALKVYCLLSSGQKYKLSQIASQTGSNTAYIRKVIAFFTRLGVIETFKLKSGYVGGMKYYRLTSKTLTKIKMNQNQLRILNDYIEMREDKRDKGYADDIDLSVLDTLYELKKELTAIEYKTISNKQYSTLKLQNQSLLFTDELHKSDDIDMALIESFIRGSDFEKNLRETTIIEVNK